MQTQTTPPVVATPPPPPGPAAPAPETPEPPDLEVSEAPDPVEPLPPPRRPAAPLDSAPDSVATGEASWYGEPYHGRPTASGEIYDKNKLTAAHRTLPFDTWVRVENELNGLEVDVRINDRGPFVTGRIVDLSEAAAREIDMLGDGVVPVSVRVVRESPDAASERPEQHVFYVVQVGAFREESRAHELRRELERRYTGVYVEGPGEGSSFYRVRIGRALLSDARMLQDLIQQQEDIESIVLEME
jgi:rare lipoprotein A